MSQKSWNIHLLVWIYSLILIASFAFSVGWTAVGLDDPPNVARQKWMQQSNHAIRTVTLILASVAGLISVIMVVNILAQKDYTHVWIPIIFLIAAGLGIANVVTDRSKRGDALGLTTMTVNGFAVVVILYYMMMHVAKNPRYNPLPIMPYGDPLRGKPTFTITQTGK